ARTGAAAGRVALGAAARGAVAVTTYTIFLLAGLEVSLVPARTLQTKAGRGHQLHQRAFATLRAVRQWRLADLLELLQHGRTRFTFVFVNGHIVTPLISTPHGPSVGPYEKRGIVAY